jgi:putative ABC transport system permease protein
MPAKCRPPRCFREQGFEARGLPSWPYILLAAVFLMALAGLAVVTAHDRKIIAVVFIGAIAFAFVILRLVAAGIAWLARRSPRVSSPALRLAIGNIHRPGALTPSVVLSLGLGLALLVTLALIDGNMRQQLTGVWPEARRISSSSTSRAEVENFRNLVKAQAPDGKLIEVPMLRGRILSLNGQDVTKIKVPPGGQWVLRGDRGITYSRRSRKMPRWHRWGTGGRRTIAASRWFRFGGR